MAQGILAQWDKQPTEARDWNFDYSQFLADKGADTIASVAVTVAPSGLSIYNVSHLNGVVNFFASGGVSGTTYQVTCRVTTTGGRVEEGDAKIKVKES